MFSINSSPIKLGLLLLVFIGGTYSQEALETENIAIGFAPYVRPFSHTILYERGYNESDIESMLSVISNRFQKITVFQSSGGTNSTKHIFSASARIPQLVATHNTQAPPQRQLSLTLRTMPNITQIPTTVKIITETNSIHPNTINRVLLSVGSINSTLYFHKVTTYLRELDSKLENSGIKVGIDLALEQCDLEDDLMLKYIHGIFHNFTKDMPAPPLPPKLKLPFATQTLLEMVDFVVFVPEAIMIIEESATKTFDYITKELDLCERTIKDSLPWKELGVHLQFQWASKGEAEEENVYDFVEYWKAAGKWGKETNRDVFMNEAFDNPLKSFVSGKEKSANYGWWRMRNLNNPVINADAFVEKTEDMKTAKRPLKKEPPKQLGQVRKSIDDGGADDGGKKKGVKVWKIVLPVALLLVAIGGVAFYLIRKRRRHASTMNYNRTLMT